MSQIKEEKINGNVLIFKNNLAHNLLNQIKDAMRYMKIPRKCLYLLFDDDNLDTYSKWAGKLGKMLNIPEGGYDYPAPDYIDQIFNKISDNDFTYFIWIAGKVYNNPEPNLLDEINLLWNLIHEFQHLKHDVQYSSVYLLVNNFLGSKEVYREVHLKWTTDIPDEYDAERRAKEFIIIEYGTEHCEEYLENWNLGEDRRRNLLKININQLLDPKMETLKLLCGNKNLLKRKQETSKKFKDKFDIEEICKSQSFG